MFSEVWTYVILLIVQKKVDYLPVPRAKIAKVFTNPGVALEDFLENDSLSNDYVEIYTAPQSSFIGSEWTLLSAGEQAILAKFNALPKLNTMFEVMQGLATGDDSVFIVDQPVLGEEGIYKPFLPDKSIRRYMLPKNPSRYVIYPYKDDKLINSDTLSKEYPKTWKYLNRFKDKLKTRSRKSEKNWWSLSTPRHSSVFEELKIITPNLVLDGKFAIDSNIGYYLTRTTFIFLKEDILNDLSLEKHSDEHLMILRFYTVLMNTRAFMWSVSHKARKYAQSYIKIEVNLLRDAHVPDFRSIRRRDYLEIVNYAILAEETGNLSIDIQKRIEVLVARMYGLTSEDIDKISHD